MRINVNVNTRKQEHKEIVLAKSLNAMIGSITLMVLARIKEDAECPVRNTTEAKYYIQFDPLQVFSFARPKQASRGNIDELQDQCSGIILIISLMR